MSAHEVHGRGRPDGSWSWRGQRLLAVVSTLALTVGLASALAAPAANAAPEGPSSPLKVEFFHGDGPAGGEGLVVMSCFTDNAQTSPRPCSMPGLMISASIDGTDVYPVTEEFAADKMAWAYTLPTSVGEYELTISTIISGSQDLTLTGTTYDPTRGAVEAEAGRVERGASTLGITHPDDSEIESYEYVALTLDGVMSTSTRVAEGQQYRIPDVGNTSYTLLFRIAHATDGRSTYSYVLLEPEQAPDLGAWTISDTHFNPVKLDDGNDVRGTVTCENVDAEPVDCLGGPHDSGFTVTFNDLVWGGSGRGHSEDGDAGAPGTQFGWGTGYATAEGENTADVRLFDDKNSETPLASRTDTYRAYVPAANAAHVYAIHARNDALRITYLQFAASHYNMTVQDAAGRTVLDDTPGVSGVITARDLEPDSDYFVTWNASEYDLLNETWTHKTSSFWVTTKSTVQAPTNLARTVDGEDLVLTWDAPGNAAKFDDLSYRVKVDDADPMTVEDTTYRIENVPANTDVEVQVAPVVIYRAYGTGAVGEPVTATVRRDLAPNPPVDPFYDGYEDAIVWDAPEQVGDQEITGFLVETFHNGQALEPYTIDADGSSWYWYDPDLAGLDAGEWVFTVRTLAGEQSSEPVEAMRYSVDLADPTVNIVDGVVHFSTTDDLDLINEWYVLLYRVGDEHSYAADWLDPDATSWTLPTDLPPADYQVFVQPLPLDGFDYEKGSTRVDFTDQGAGRSQARPQA